MKERLEEEWRQPGCAQACHFAAWRVEYGGLVSKKQGRLTFPKFTKLKAMLARFRRRELKEISVRS